MKHAWAVVLAGLLPDLGACGGSSGTEDTAAVDASGQATASSGPGTCRLFFTLDPTTGQGKKTLRSAVSSDGFTFTIEEETWSDAAMADPAVRRGKDNVWRVAFCAVGGNGVLGIGFASHAETPFFPAADLIFSGDYQYPDFLEMDDGWRMYFGHEGIGSAFSQDGLTYEPESGKRLAENPPGMAMSADPTVARRKDGSYVMYYKCAPPLSESDGTPYSHVIYRAFSGDGLNWTPENQPLVEHASVPGATTDASGRVWVYFLYFGDGWPGKKETIWAAYENDDGSLSSPKAVEFVGGVPGGYWTNNPSPMLLSE
ncbi:MAG: hypothetical protein HYY17_08805 [Planctomycetes bacterium]|nr:hypothetical protein [Planctomycetota bacterium]